MMVDYDGRNSCFLVFASAFEYFTTFIIFIISSFGFSTLTNMNLIKHVILFTHLVDGAYFFVCFRYWVKINIDRYERL